MRWSPALHKCSPRKTGAFVSIRCTIPNWRLRLTTFNHIANADFHHEHDWCRTRPILTVLLPLDCRNILFPKTIRKSSVSDKISTANPQVNLYEQEYWGRVKPKWSRPYSSSNQRLIPDLLVWYIIKILGKILYYSSTCSSRLMVYTDDQCRLEDSCTLFPGEWSKTRETGS